MPTTESRIECLAESVLEAHEMDSLPIEPLEIARREKILAVAGDYDGCFEARIEHRLQNGLSRFALFYNNDSSTPARVRFSQAHELGHFYLPEHRQFLMTGEWLGRRRQFLRAKRVEREANWFAAALLMPRQIFIDQVQRRRSSPCTLVDIEYLADEVFHTSVLSTALRYVQLNFEPCCVVVSEQGSYRYGIPSDALRSCNCRLLPRVPRESKTGEQWATLSCHIESNQDASPQSWLHSENPISVHEDVWLDADANIIVTLLTVQSE